MTRPTLLDGDELDALIENFRALEPCPDCGGKPALLIHTDNAEPVVAHRVDCPDALAVAVGNALQDILGGHS